MRIEEIDIHHLKSFRFGSDSTLHVDFMSELQIVMGTNGAGKSRYIAQLNPYPSPSPKTTYQDDGYRRMVISHQGATIVLENDYGRKDGTHRFYITNSEFDNHNLNESGNSNIQKELIDRYLGLTKEKVQLLHGEISITSMSNGQREALLNKLAPADLWFMIEHQKKIGKVIRGLKAELVYLTKRESELLSRIMTEEDRRDFQNKKDTINTEILSLIGEKGGLSERRRFQTEELAGLGYLKSSVLLESDLCGVTTELRTCEETCGTEEVSAETYRQRVTHLEDQIKAARQEAIEVFRQIREMEATLEKSSHAHTEEKNHRLEALRLQLQGLGATTSDPLTQDEVRDLRAVRPRVEAIVDVLGDLPTKLISRQEYRTLAQEYERHRNEDYRIGVALETIAGKEEELRRQLDRGADVRGIEPCAKNACPLYAFAVSTRTNREEELHKLLEEQSALQAKRKEGEVKHADHGDIVNGLRDAMEQLDRLSGLLNQASALGRYFTADLMTILCNNPHGLLTRIDGDLDKAEATWAAERINREIDKLKAELAANESIGEDYRALLLTEKENKEKRGEELNERIQVLSTDLHTQQKSLDLVERVVNLRKDRDTLITQITKAKRKEVLETELRSIVERILHLDRDMDGKTSELGSIDNLLAEQDRVVAQYEGEVKRRKMDVELSLKELEDTETALKGIPEEATKQWLSSLVAQVNVYLALVWSHRFEVEFDMDAPLSYSFPKYVKTERSNDISESSKGEKRMLDLAFSLALRDSLGMNDYPLFLDEMGDGFDITHTNKIVDLVKTLQENHRASQIVLVNHQAAVSSGFVNTQTFVVDEENILVPEVYNEGITIS